MRALKMDFDTKELIGELVLSLEEAAERIESLSEEGSTVPYPTPSDLRNWADMARQAVQSG